MRRGRGGEGVRPAAGGDRRLTERRPAASAAGRRVSGCTPRRRAHACRLAVRRECTRRDAHYSARPAAVVWWTAGELEVVGLIPVALSAPGLNPDSTPELLRALHAQGLPVETTRKGGGSGWTIRSSNLCWSTSRATTRGLPPREIHLVVGAGRSRVQRELPGAGTEMRTASANPVPATMAARCSMCSGADPATTCRRSGPCQPARERQPMAAYQLPPRSASRSVAASRLKSTAESPGVGGM